MGHTGQAVVVVVAADTCLNRLDQQQNVSTFATTASKTYAKRKLTFILVHADTL